MESTQSGIRRDGHDAIGIPCSPQIHSLPRLNLFRRYVARGQSDTGPCGLEDQGVALVR
jgi:hypothetical protein